MCRDSHRETLEAHGLIWEASTAPDGLRRYSDQLGRNVGALDVRGLELDDIQRLDASMMATLADRAAAAEGEAR